MAESNRVMLDLAERCEKAEGPDRDLELEIWKATDSHAFGDAFYRHKGIAPKGADDSYTLRRMRGLSPAYTASLDAALTLVPEGHDVQVSLFFGRDGEGSATVSRLKQINLPKVFAATPALALCAAALRARQTPDTSRWPL